MSLSPDLLLAILSMDAYNRSYNAGIGIDAKVIGTAAVKIDSETIFKDPAIEPAKLSSAAAAGFYAVAYDTEYGTVISYRGTDNPSLFSNVDAGGGDIYKGWVTGGGAWQTNQVRLAQEFFEAVTGMQDRDPRDGQAILTGHSLGGGLAGFIASLHGKQAIVFDNMPFELASDSAQASAVSDKLFGIFYKDYAQRTFYNGGEPWETDRSKISGAYFPGEVLQAIRPAQATQLDALSSHGGLRDPVDLHSISLLAILQFAKDAGYTAWQPTGGPLLGARCGTMHSSLGPMPERLAA
ncbi:hypothetical protein [Agrobacterium deltaense]|uniref:hypothetical protein n=1 Tax=Agrobacterium deltaense TaxID=1183412 RepID=UPI000F63F49E|nr:hypothetical protein [Agrobacterium deltaense]RRN67241.1 hypothetical protein EIQ31_23235 [Agrobacterium deltaense]